MDQQQLEDCKNQLRLKEKWQDHLNRAEMYIKDEGQKVDQLKKQLKKEREDVERLEGISLSNLIYTITGRKLEKLDKEQQELAAAQLKYDEAIHTIKDLGSEIDEIKKYLTALGNPREEYKRLMKEKVRFLYANNKDVTKKINKLANDEANKRMVLNELEEAIVAGRNAQTALQQAISSLDYAKGWSTWDLFGGGMISTAIKHSKIDEAKKEIHDAQRKLRLFEEEMKDVQKFASYSIDISGMLTFADYFFDGFIVDWMVHGKINDSLNQTEKMKKEVEQAIVSLRTFQERIQMEKSEIKQQRMRLIEQA
ncbi:hypothetical protein RYX56_04970 [Alkalihalophilus lindianensis]|uniref:Uncharacterized protein n=1 Tax=Alkalihalophilus lindianensis TaxID=1630542 RepID=A0ABU3X774_9BACI|nr:hypothetical protein [Alkalihalophilus lindianensis]MDV2683727.1 hypothetical protein [Alkalihalophilus lindianensis]